MEIDFEELFLECRKTELPVPKTSAQVQEISFEQLLQPDKTTINQQLQEINKDGIENHRKEQSIRKTCKLTEEVHVTQQELLTEETAQLEATETNSSLAKATSEVSDKKNCNKSEGCHHSSALSPCDCEESYPSCQKERPHIKKHRIKRHTCPECGKKCANLNEHLNSHAKVKAYECRQCQKKFKYSQSLKAHEISHSGLTPISCRFCDEKFTTNGMLRNHLLRHPEYASLSCPYCEKKFLYKSQLNPHIARHLGPKSRLRNRTTHLANRKENSNKTSSIIKSPTLTVVINRLENHKESKGPYCNVCQLPFKENSLLQEHLKSHIFPLSNRQQLYPCLKCNFVFTTSTYLKDHLCQVSSSHENRLNPQRFNCNRCFAHFASKSCLQKHLLQQHEKKLLNCQYCSKKFTWQSFLKKHLLTHSVEKPFPCHLCDRAYSYKSLLKQHLVRHSREGDLQCPDCQKTFIQEKHLTELVLTHCLDCKVKLQSKSLLNKSLIEETKVKAFTCTECGKGFTQRPNLKSHMLTHLGLKPYACSHCCKKFVSKSRLKVHLRVHEGKFECNFCGKGYVSMTALRYHLQSH